MHKGLAFALIGATLVGGYFIGKATRGNKGEETSAVAWLMESWDLSVNSGVFAFDTSKNDLL